MRKVDARRRDVLDQCRRERTVAAPAVAVGGERTGARGECDQRVGGRRFDLGEAAADRTRAAGAFHQLGKRVFPAGIENDQPQALGGLENLQHAFERDRFVLDVDIGLEPGIDRDEVVRAVDLDAVAGVVDCGDIGIAHRIGEFA
jgi:hypothetical protein